MLRCGRVDRSSAKVRKHESVAGKATGTTHGTEVSGLPIAKAFLISPLKLTFLSLTQLVLD